MGKTCVNSELIENLRKYLYNNISSLIEVTKESVPIMLENLDAVIDVGAPDSNRYFASVFKKSGVTEDVFKTLVSGGRSNAVKVGNSEVEMRKTCHAVLVELDDAYMKVQGNFENIEYGGASIIVSYTAANMDMSNVYSLSPWTFGGKTYQFGMTEAQYRAWTTASEGGDNNFATFRNIMGYPDSMTDAEIMAALSLSDAQIAEFEATHTQSEEKSASSVDTASQNPNKEKNLSGDYTGTNETTTNSTNWLRNGDNGTQINGSSSTYVFSAEFNDMLDNTVADLLDDVRDGKFTDEEKSYLQEVLPYIIKGVGASESSWGGSDDYNASTDGCYVGLHQSGTKWNDGLANTFETKRWSTNVNDYSTVEDGVEMAGAMLINWYVAKKNEGYSIEDAIWEAQAGYTYSTSSATYQLAMANDFYAQDNDGAQLFSGSTAAHITAAENGTDGTVYRSSSNNTQVQTVTVTANGTTITK